MDLRKIKKLIEMLQESDLNEIEVREGEESVRINREKEVQHVVHQSAKSQASQPGKKSKKAPEVTDYVAVEFEQEVLERACTALFDYVKAFGSCFHVGENCRLLFSCSC